jgi:outer membrane immunogenic protein
MKKSAFGLMFVFLFVGSQAYAADMPLKAPVPAPAQSWTGFYVGGEVGGAWSDPHLTIAPTMVLRRSW